MKNNFPIFICVTKNHFIERLSLDWAITMKAKASLSLLLSTAMKKHLPEGSFASGTLRYTLGFTESGLHSLPGEAILTACIILLRSADQHPRFNRAMSLSFHFRRAAPASIHCHLLEVFGFIFLDFFNSRATSVSSKHSLFYRAMW